MTPDTVALPYLTGLLEATAAELAASQLADGLCYTGVKPGASVSYDVDGDCSGMVWTRLASAFPCSGPFPAPDEVAPRRGQPMRLAVTIEVGLVHGIELPENGEPQDEVTEYGQTERQLAEQAAIMRAICAYFRRRRFDDWSLGAYQPVGPEGGTLGGVWSVTARRS